MTRNPCSKKSLKNYRTIQEGDQDQEEEEEEAPGASEIGSRVFPFRSPASSSAASMPTVGTRRSTRVFLPRQQRTSAGDGGSERILRSGKRFDIPTAKEVDRSECLKVVEDETKERIEEKKRFGAVYGRRRRRLMMENCVKDRRFGIVYQRKHSRKVTRKALAVELEVWDFLVLQCSKKFGERLGIIADGDLWSGLECGSVVLAVLVNSSVSSSSDRFGHFLVSVMEWMRRTRVELLDLVVFLFGRSIGSVFSMNGIHFLPIQNHNNRILNKNSVPGCGLCKVYGAKELVPLLSVDYSSLPFYFKHLHSVIILGSHYLPSILRSKSSVHVLENQLVIVPSRKHVDGDDDHVETALPGAEFLVSASPAVKRDEMPAVGNSCVPISHNPGPPGILSSSSLRKHQRKRTSLKNLRALNPSIMNTHLRSFRSIQSSSVSTSTRCNFADSLVTVKPHDPCLPNLFSGREDSDVALTPVSCSKLKNTAGKESPIEKVKELRSALAEVRQNMDSACCNANILVTDTEKGWREDGAQVRLEFSDSQEWFIAVNRGDNTRFLYKPQDFRPCVVNRFNHAYIWSGNDGWMLEFVDKCNWHIFKALHMECHTRNTPVVSMNAIPVPGVREVSGYEDDADRSFVRPDTYINVMNDEVGRALASEISYCDMDLADEEWLRNLNSSSSDAQDGGTSYVSEDNFEKIIFALEKDAYCRLNDASNRERVLDLCQGLGTGNMVSAIYDYWLKKRKLKRAPLVRVFQGPPLRKTQLMKKPFLQRKRSFKRQRSQVDRNQFQRKLRGKGKPDLFFQGGKGKPDLFFQGGKGKQDLFFQGDQELVRRVNKAEAAASRATEVATKLRSIAQKFMSNADLASYKAAMALRIAETIWVSEPSDLDSSSILFD